MKTTESTGNERSELLPPAGSPPLPWAMRATRRANWDKQTRMVLQIGPRGESTSVTVSFEGRDESTVRKMSTYFVAAYNASVANAGADAPSEKGHG